MDIEPGSPPRKPAAARMLPMCLYSASFQHRQRDTSWLLHLFDCEGFIAERAAPAGSLQAKVEEATPEDGASQQQQQKDEEPAAAPNVPAGDDTQRHLLYPVPEGVYNAFNYREHCVLPTPCLQTSGDRTKQVVMHALTSIMAQLNFPGLSLFLIVPYMADIVGALSDDPKQQKNEEGTFSIQVCVRVHACSALQPEGVPENHAPLFLQDHFAKLARQCSKPECCALQPMVLQFENAVGAGHKRDSAGAIIVGEGGERLEEGVTLQDVAR